mgnify:CR=1 FL=1
MKRLLTEKEKVNIRTGTNLTQEAFATKYGIPVRTLQEWEQGRSTPPDYVLNLLKKEISNEFDFEKLRIPPKTKFKVITEHFLNAERIHPIMQRDVLAIINDLKKDNNVKRITVFGSSVTSFVKSESDIDLYIELKHNKFVERTLIEHPADYWTNFTVVDEMLKEIKTKGVVVYES